MAVWIDDLLPERDKWVETSAEGHSALVEIWTFCKRAKNNGVFSENRADDIRALRRYPNVLDELIAKRWMHRGGQGCNSDLCPKGIPGTLVVHDFLEHNESAEEMGARIDVKREGAKKGNHIKWHKNRGIVLSGCKWCDGDEAE